VLTYSIVSLLCVDVHSTHRHVKSRRHISGLWTVRVDCRLYAGLLASELATTAMQKTKTRKQNVTGRDARRGLCRMCVSTACDHVTEELQTPITTATCVKKTTTTKKQKTSETRRLARSLDATRSRLICRRGTARRCVPLEEVVT